MKALNKLNELKNKLNFSHIIMVNILLIGFIIVLNSMIRFNSQIFSCSFWLTCNQESSFSNAFNLITQFILSSLGLITFIIAIFVYRYDIKEKGVRKFIIISIALASLIFFFSFYSLFINPVNPFVLILLPFILAIILTIMFVKIRNIDRSGEIFTGKNKITILFLISSILMIGLGILLSITGSANMCNQFPLCFSQTGFSFDILLINLHRLFTLTTGFFITFLTITTWRRYRENKDMLLSVTISFIVFIGQIIIGGVQATKNLPTDLLFVHSTSSVIYLLSVVYIFHSEKYVRKALVVETKTIFNDPQRRKDFLILNKPIIVALLLVTTYAGMVVGGERIPSFALTFWTMLGGALAAGGASAINQYIDRKIDLSMQRTAKRPLPAGRLHPTEALTLGISEIILSFYILAALC